MCSLEFHFEKRGLGDLFVLQTISELGMNDAHEAEESFASCRVRDNTKQPNAEVDKLRAAVPGACTRPHGTPDEKKVHGGILLINEGK